MVWNVTLLAFLKKESGLQISVNHSTGNNLYSEVMLSGNTSLKQMKINEKWASVQAILKNINAF